MADTILDDSNNIVSKNPKTLRELAAICAAEIYNAMYCNKGCEKVNDKYFTDYFELMKSINRARHKK